MQPIGWIIFIVSNAVILTLVTFCFYRVLTIPKEHMHAPLDIDTHDLEETPDDEEEEDISLPGSSK